MSENVFWSFTDWSSTVTIRAGDTVTWENRGQDSHNAEAEDGSWRSGTLRPGRSYSRRFDTPGVYPYVCTLHLAEEMTGKVVVLAAGSSPTPIPSALTRKLFIPYTAR